MLEVKGCCKVHSQSESLQLAISVSVLGAVLEKVALVLQDC